LLQPILAIDISQFWTVAKKGCLCILHKLMCLCQLEATLKVTWRPSHHVFQTKKRLNWLPNFGDSFVGIFLLDIAILIKNLQGNLEKIFRKFFKFQGILKKNCSSFRRIYFNFKLPYIYYFFIYIFLIILPSFLYNAINKTLF
jgi:hypothetical protein